MKLWGFQSNNSDLRSLLQKLEARFNQLKVSSSSSPILLQIFSKKQTIKEQKRIPLMNGEDHFEFSIDLKIKSIRVHTKDECKISISVEKSGSSSKFTAFGPFPNTVDLQEYVKRGDKIYFIPDRPINHFYAEIFGKYE